MDWTTDQNGRTVTYGQALLRAVVRYYDGWKERNQDDSLVGINVLEIGEIRVGAEGFYLLCKVRAVTARMRSGIKAYTRGHLRMPCRSIR